MAETVRATLSLQPFAPEEALRAFQTLAATGEAGAVVTFTGHARRRAKDGAAVERLVLDHHPRLTQRSLETIAADGAARFDVTAVEVIHRAGSIAPGEAIVWVAVASAHRRAAFEAADYLMDRLKTEAIFWKREEGAQGSTWIEPSEADHADRDRWNR